jgi:hypothetical protein
MGRIVHLCYPPDAQLGKIPSVPTEPDMAAQAGRNSKGGIWLDSPVGRKTTKERKMKLVAGITALTLLAGGQALAQAVTVDLSPEQRTTIKQYVVKERVAPVTVKERISVGATLPADVELRSVPGTWGPSVTKYRYVYSDNRVYFVEPSSRKVVHVID